jgi:hypothetical protein
MWREERDMELINPDERMHLTTEGLVISTSQELTPATLAQMEEDKENFRMKLNGLTQVASIPAAVADKWVREGFDFWNAPAKEILAKLRKDEMTKFIISGDKRF